MFYQTLIGVWPTTPEPAPLPDRAPADLVVRLNAYMQKAIREAKVHTSWIDEDQAYGRAVTRFVERTLTGEASVRFLRSLVPLAMLWAPSTTASDTPDRRGTREVS